MTSLSPIGTPPTGRRQLVDGRHYFIDRSGTDGPPVIFLPGAGAMALDYWNLHGPTAALATSVLYDRGGTGWSDPVALPRTMAEVTDELRRILGVVGLDPPFVLVGHSLGGGYARHYAQRFPREVAGLLLLDPLHEDGNRHFPRRVVEMQEAMKSQPMAELPPGMIEAYRAAFVQKFAAWPAEIRDPLIEQHLRAWRTGIVEGSNVDGLYQELRQGGPLPDVPVIVMTALAIDPMQRQFMEEEDLRGINAAKLIMNRGVVASVDRGEHRELPAATHVWLHLDDSAAVVQAIADLLGRIEA